MEDYDYDEMTHKEAETKAIYYGLMIVGGVIVVMFVATAVLLYFFG